MKSINDLKTEFQFSESVYWMLFFLIPVLIACSAIIAQSVFWMIIYLFVFIFLFTVVIYRFFCTHCPHYNKPEKTCNCMFYWGFPKYFKGRPEPLSGVDKLMTMLGFAIAVLFPVYWLLNQKVLLLAYLLSCIVVGMTLRRFECHRCIYFECPANTVDASLREEFRSIKY